jgi:hypothetical protein
LAPGEDNAGANLALAPLANCPRLRCLWPAGETVPVDVGELQLVAGVGTLLAEDNPHPGLAAGWVQQPVRSAI